MEIEVGARLAGLTFILATMVMICWLVETCP